MAIFTRTLTVESVKEATSNREHAAIAAFDSLGKAHWENLRRATDACEKEHEAYAPYVKAFAPFAVILERKEFTLNPLDLVSIWSMLEGLKFKHVHAGYGLAHSLALTYGTSTMKNADWKNLYGWVADDEMDALMHLMDSETPDAIIFQSRLLDIYLSSQELDNLNTSHGHNLDASTSGLLRKIGLDVRNGLSPFLTRKVK
jgi:hypothetical protein